MAFEIRTIGPDAFPDFIRTIDAAFIGSMEEGDVAVERAISDPERSFAAFEDGAMVGGAYDTALPISLPGGALMTTAAVVGVGVLPTHTRRGLNTALMRAQLDAMRERGDAVAILHASEGGIYGRFGYGLATVEVRGDLETAHGRFVKGIDATGRVRLVGREEARLSVEAIEAVVRPAVPGMADAVGPGWFDYRFPARHHGEDQNFQFAVHETDGVVDAYAVYAVKHEWAEGIPRNVLDVWQLVAATPQATADMWRYVLGVDLVERVRTHRRPADDPLLHMLADPRRLRARIIDGLWLRLVDLRAALEARGYTADGTIVLDVDDAFCPWNSGRHRLEVSAGVASCEPTDDPADLTCTTNDLAAVYLGGSSFHQLRDATRVTESRDGALDLADTMFRTARSPWCQVMF